MVKMATLNGKLFMPWLIVPNDKKIDWSTEQERKENIQDALNFEVVQIRA